MKSKREVRGLELFDMRGTQMVRAYGRTLGRCSASLETVVSTALVFALTYACPLILSACWSTSLLPMALFFFFNVYLIFGRETESEQGRGRERERERDKEPETGSRL